MRNGIRVLAVASTLGLMAGCGRVTSAALTGPSPVSSTATTAPAQPFPPLTGRWRASGRVELRNLENGNTLSWGGCSGSFDVTAQDGSTFSGPFGTQGQGWNSDRFCTAFGTFSGELAAPDGSVVRARLEGNFQNWPRPSVTPPCELVSAGDGVWTGSASSDSIRLQIGDVLRCPVNGDGGLSTMPMADFARTVSFTFQRW